MRNPISTISVVLSLLVSSIRGTHSGSNSLSPRYEHHAVLERRNTAATKHTWEKKSRVDARQVLPVRIGLSQQNLHRADEFLMDVSNPGSPNYAQHWTPEQVKSTFAPSQEAVDEVRAWLCSVDELLCDEATVTLSAGRGWLAFNASVEQVERLLRTTYHVYEHRASGVEQIASGSYSVPVAVREHVDYVTPTMSLPPSKRQTQEQQRRRRRQLATDKKQKASAVSTVRLGPAVAVATASNGTDRSNDTSQCDVYISPACIRALYGIPQTLLTAPNNSLGVVEYSPQFFEQDDLENFFSYFAPGLVGLPPTFVSIDGGYLSNDTSDPDINYDVESNLDLEYAMALAQGLTVAIYETGDPVEGGSFNNFLDALDASYCTFEGGDDPDIDPVYPDPYNYTDAYTGPQACGTTTPPYVISTSYSADEWFLPASYMNRQCYEYMKLGLMGTTVLFSSGDGGVEGSQAGNCFVNNGIYDVFVPSFPGVCPYITSVGGTQLNANATLDDPEVAALFSGGGFANTFDLPDYQKLAVGSFWENFDNQYSFQQFNTSQQSRGFPDISATSVNYIIGLNEIFYLVNGTSASTPVVGAIITRLNDELLNAGKKPIGFINPALYAHPEVLNDITEGSNPGCRTNGFNASVGWDPVTGLGTPNYPKMLDYFMSLQS